MKTPTKVLIVTLVLGVGLPLLTWTATFLYWHLRITRAVRIIETRRLVELADRTPEWNETCSFLTMDSCRSMPYLVRALHPSQNSEFLNAASYIVCRRSIDTDAVDHITRLEEWSISPIDSPDLLRRRIDLMQAWWARHGAEHHPWWKIWSWECP